MRKSRCDCVLDSLPQNQRADLHTWLIRENLSLVKTQQRIAELFHIKVSLSQISRFGRKLRLMDEVLTLQDQLEKYESSLRASPDRTGKLLDTILHFRALELGTREKVTSQELWTMLQIANERRLQH